MSWPWFYYVCRAAVRAFLLFIRYEVKEIENIPPQGPVLVVANHLSLADPPLLGTLLGRKVVFMAKKELFRFRAIGYLVSGLGAFPVHRGQLDRKALRKSLQALEQGKTLVVFPEGMRSRSGQLQCAFPGVTLIALRSGAPIVPVGIWGTEELEGIRWLFKRPRIMVNIGKPFTLPSVDGKLTKEELTKLTNSIMWHVADLLPLEYQGYYRR